MPHNENNKKDLQWYPPDWITIPFCMIFFGIMIWMLLTILHWTSDSQCQEGITLIGNLYNQVESIKEFFKNLHIK
jgi:hypothetical protein